MDFYNITIPKEVQPSLALSVEREELGIAAGLQDRVVQAYQGLVFMDFSRELMEAQATENMNAWTPGYCRISMSLTAPH